MAKEFDYIIVGAGSSGCVIAERLTADGRTSVLLLEAGERDNSFLIDMPKGIGKLLANPKYTWTYTTEAESGIESGETWVRGRVLGGSSSINGMMYNRGRPEDYDSLVEVGCPGWGWDDILPYFRAMEDHELGANEWRGSGGPMRITLPEAGGRLGTAILEAGSQAGLSVEADFNTPAGHGLISYFPRTIGNGQRWSAARAYLGPARNRPNLTVRTGTTVEAILFEGRRAVGVRSSGDPGTVFKARCEIILAAGGIESPALLQRSGIGPGDLLSSLGIPVVQESGEVGRNLLEHRVLSVNWRTAPEYSLNHHFSGWRLYGHVMRYLLTRGGLMATGFAEVGALVETRKGLSRPNAQLLFAPYSIDRTVSPPAIEAQPGITVSGFILRPTSKGYLNIRGREAGKSPRIKVNYLDTEHDRQAAVEILQYIRGLALTPALGAIGASEVFPGPEASSAEEVVDAWRRLGHCGYHLVGGCRMGSDERSVVDPRLKVRGVDSLRVFDCSVLPIMIAGNTNGPIMAMAARAADIIKADAG